MVVRRSRPQNDFASKQLPECCIYIDNLIKQTVMSALRPQSDAASHFLSAIAESSQDAIFTIDLNGIVTIWNRAAASLFGFAATEVTGRPLTELSLPPELQELPRHIDQVKESGASSRLAPLRIRKDGRDTDIEIRMSPVTHESGAVLGILAVGRNITERNETEEALRAIEARFRLLADAIPQIIWTNEGGGKANYFNKRWFEYSGLSLEESIGPGWEVIVHPDDAASSVRRWEEDLRAGRVFETEYRLRRADGVYRWHLGRNIPLIGEDGKALGWFGTATDIEDIKRSEAALSQREEQLRITIESIHDYAIFTLDNDRRVTSWNPGAEIIFGFSPDEILGKSGDIIFTPEDIIAGVPEKEAGTALTVGKAQDERWHVRKDGTRFYASGVVTRMGRGAQGLVKVARDLTDRIKAEKVKDTFIGIASHELRTPLTSIKAYVELLSDTLVQTKDEESMMLVQKLDAQVDRLTGLVKSLLDVTRINEGKIRLNKRRFNLNDLIREIADELRPTTRHHLELNLSELPDISADQERIRQAIINLCSNAIKYSPQAEKIRITTESNDEGITMCVQDYGIGLSAEAQARVFERFYRAEDDSISTYPGLGLGLYIAMEIVERHEGRIWLNSKHGEGSVFCFFLPHTPH